LAPGAFVGRNKALWHLWTADLPELMEWRYRLGSDGMKYALPGDRRKCDDTEGVDCRAQRRR
jgi:hypothetical protein